MSRDYNKIVLTGRLSGGREGLPVDLKITPTNGKAVARFSVACGRSIRDETTESGWKDETEWFNIVAWNELAERCERMLTKGTHVLVEGRVQTRKWTDRDGNTRYTTEVVANDVNILSSKAERDRLSGGESSDMSGDDDMGELPAPSASRQMPAPPRAAAPQRTAPATGNGYRSGGSTTPPRTPARSVREPTREPLGDDGMEPDDIPF